MIINNNIKGSSFSLPVDLKQYAETNVFSVYQNILCNKPQLVAGTIMVIIPKTAESSRLGGISNQVSMIVPL